MQVVLEVPGEKELRAVTEKLTEAGVQVRQCTQFFSWSHFGHIESTRGKYPPAGDWLWKIWSCNLLWRLGFSVTS